MAGVAIMVALAGLQLGKAFMTDDSEIASGQQALDAEQSAAPVAEQAEAPATDAAETSAPTAPPADEQTAAVPSVEEPDLGATPQITEPEDSVAEAGVAAMPESDATTVTASTPAPTLMRRRPAMRRRPRPTRPQPLQRRRLSAPSSLCRPTPDRCRCARPLTPATPRRCSRSARATPKAAA